MLSYCQDVIDTIELLRSIFFDEEFEFSSQKDQQIFESLIEEMIPKEKEYLEVTIKTPVAESDVQLVFYCQIALMDSKGYRLTLPSSENGWLTRQDHEQLTACLNEKNDKQEDRASEILENIQQIKSVAESIVMEQQEEKKETVKDDKEPIEFLREWIWFPMIYTREKRGHIIDWAPSYQITGFLCPGKPGCMCLEGSKEKVAQFIHDIKTISWSDIPPSHKKMTSQWKEHVECDSKAQFESNRLFKDMTEIKFDIHGKFANHNDLNKLQTWMEKKGCGKAFDYLFECRET